MKPNRIHRQSLGFDLSMPNSQTTYLGVDTGGTFTDFVAVCGDELRIHKCLSTPDNPEQAILQGITALGLMEAASRGELVVVHGSTVATNAALEGKGVRTVFVSNRGFADMLSIGRQTRDELYNLRPPLKKPPVPRELCLETGGRLGADGSEVEALNDSDISVLLDQLRQLQPKAVAINLLFSFLDDGAEKRLAAEIEKAFPDIFVSRSSEILPEYREYERGMATWLNAWLGPLVASYLNRLQSALADTPLSIMQSSGGTTNAGNAARRAVNLLLSGPAGGLAAAKHIGQQLRRPRLITFDMGGTSSDVALIDHQISLTSEGRIGHYPVAVPMVDMHTIGAGGGSIAFIDDGGVLRVGPESAGADPGPACYGRGGKKATVTDANLVLGRLPDNAKLGGSMPLDREAARQAVAGLAGQLGMTTEATAAGIIDIANEHMLRALRVISVQRGYDPEAFTLCCFGGAGGLHICALAEGLGCDEVIVPGQGGVFSALGMLLAPRERQLSRTLNQSLGHIDRKPSERQLVDAMFAELQQQGEQELLKEGVARDAITAQASVDLCYEGQSFTLNLPWGGAADALAESFHQAHNQRYGHRLDLPVRLVNIRLALRAASVIPALPEQTFPAMDAEPEGCQQAAFIADKVPRYWRDSLALGQQINGPALICETVATTWVAQGWRAELAEAGHVYLRRVMNS